MIRAARHITRVWRDEAGTVLVELAVVLGLFVLMVFGGLVNEATTLMEDRLLRWRHLETRGG